MYHISTRDQNPRSLIGQLWKLNSKGYQVNLNIVIGGFRSELPTKLLLITLWQLPLYRNRIDVKNEKNTLPIQKSLSLSSSKGRKIFFVTIVFCFLLYCAQQRVLSANAYISMHLRLSSTLKHLKTQREIYNKSIHWMQFSVNVFKKSLFLFVFAQNGAFSECFTLKTVEKSLRVHHHLRAF